MDWNGHSVPADTFTNRPPSATQAPVYDEVTAIFTEAGERLTRTLPACAYATLSLRSLEQASMWAKKCVAFEVE